MDKAKVFAIGVALGWDEEELEGLTEEQCAGIVYAISRSFSDIVADS